jgi:RHS repeat-associated protein
LTDLRKSQLTTAFPPSLSWSLRDATQTFITNCADSFPEIQAVAGNRTGAEVDINGATVTGTASGYNDVNELQSQSGAGPVPVFFQGALDRPGTVGIGPAGGNSTPATMTQGTNGTCSEIFTATVNLPVGSNTVTLTATNLNGYASSTNYSLTVAGGQDISFAYDADGNLTNEMTATSTNEYDWDAENRLVQLTQWTNGMRLTSQFSYDGFGRMVKIVEETNGVSGSTNQFVWSGTRLCQERDGNNNVTRQFFADGAQIDGTNYYFTKDHLGSIREVTDSSGNIVARYDYDPYGVRTLVQGTDISDFGFTGYYMHKVSGLQFALCRAYDADLGRFINRDPIGEAGGLNLYDYVANNPIDCIDPLGLESDIWA